MKSCISKGSNACPAVKMQCFTNLELPDFPVFTTFSAINRPNRTHIGIQSDTILLRKAQHITAQQQITYGPRLLTYRLRLPY